MVFFPTISRTVCKSQVLSTFMAIRIGMIDETICKLCRQMEDNHEYGRLSYKGQFESKKLDLSDSSHYCVVLHFLPASNEYSSCVSLRIMKK